MFTHSRNYEETLVVQHAQALLAAGKKVRGIVRDKSKAAHLAKQGVELVTGDVSDTESLVKAMQGCEGGFS